MPWLIMALKQQVYEEDVQLSKQAILISLFNVIRQFCKLL